LSKIDSEGKTGKKKKGVTFVSANQNEAKWLLIDNPSQKKSKTRKRRIVSRGFARNLVFFMSDFSSGGIFCSRKIHRQMNETT
jgi:hypothetical protein